MNHYILTIIISLISLTSIFSNSIKLLSHTPTSSVKEEATEKIITYTITEFNGRIALFTSENTKPVKVYDIFISTLPPTDIKALRDGITVYSEKDALKLIEEYTS